MDPYAALPVTAPARAQLAALAALLREWNEVHNLVSNADLAHLEQRHFAPSLAPLLFWRLAPGATVLDVGTGGGLPGLPLAICLPQAKFVLVDSIGKKMHAVADMAKRLGLKNVTTRCARVEAMPDQFDLVLGRAVAALPKFACWVRGRLRPGQAASSNHGLWYWKGGDFSAELAALGASPREKISLEDIFHDPYFHEKYLLRFAVEDLRHATLPPP